MKSPKNSFFKKNIFKIILVLSIFFPFLLLLFDGKVIFWGTASLQFIPWSQYLFDSILDGFFPLWNPYNGLGVPFIANHQSAAFYPLNWILFPFYLIAGIKGTAIGMTLLIPLHLSIAGFGMSKILKRFGVSTFAQFAGSIVFVFSGYVLTRLSFISMVWTFAWLPWIIYHSMRLRALNGQGAIKRVIFLAFFISLQLLAGHAQTSYYTILLGFFTVICFEYKSVRNIIRKVIAFFASLLLSISFSAIQILPTYELLMNSQRSAEVGYELAVSSSLWPGRLITALFGNFWGNPNYGRFLSGGSFWEENIYLGVFPILLIIVLLWFLTRNNRSSYLSKELKIYLLCSLGMVIFSLFFSLGRFFPLFPFLYKYIPTFDLFQAPSRFLIIYVFMMSILTAIGFDLWSRSKFNIRKTLFFPIVFGSLLLITLLIKIFYKDFPEISLISLLVGSVMGILFGIITLLRDKSIVNNLCAQSAILIILFLDLLIHNFSWNFFQSIETYQVINYHSNAFTDRVLLTQEAEHFLKFNLFFRSDRLQPLTKPSAYPPDLIPNTNLLNNRYQLINNFDPLQLQDFSKFWVWLDGLQDSELESIISLIGGQFVYDLVPKQSDYLLKNETVPKDLIQWYECTVKGDKKLDFNQMLNLEIANSENRCLIIEEEVLNIGNTSTKNQRPYIDYQIINPNHIRIEYQSDRDGWIVIRQNWFPGWKAFLDETQSLEVEKVDYLFQGMQVPQGSHSLDLLYIPNSFKYGIIISVSSILIAVIIICCPIYRKKR